MPITNAATNSIYDAVAAVSNISLDTMSVEERDYFKSEHGIEFLNSTSNQGICFGNWLSHPQNVVKAAKLVSESVSVPKSVSAPDFDEFVSKVIVQAIAVTGSLQSKGIKNCVLSQINPDLANDTEAIVKYATAIINAYAVVGVDKSKVIIKLPITWESMQAAKQLTASGIQCLGTVCHTLEQAVLAAEAGCVAISPYVDDLGVNIDPSSYVVKPLEENYGYQMTKQVHMYYRAYGIKTINCIAATIGLDVILALSGVDEMTIPVVALYKMINTSVPEGVVTPGLKKTYTKEEAGPELSFINGGADAYNKAFESNKIGVERYHLAINTFSSFQKKAEVLVKNCLVEYGIVKA
ncbi:hypothetical protein DASC09_040930 [Saccharomycopsis crataegensis]|uniref:Transaldolase n=1 Tax=Saccharomycopsis crataegensis TaxID=43959 RepID=A0AAV5QPG9_9ASCO|nr:hypothetical protein DASC09_040930 [Saccharomycopsis crataegensis]